jgi:hypothetical protein
MADFRWRSEIWLDECRIELAEGSVEGRRWGHETGWSHRQILWGRERVPKPVKNAADFRPRFYLPPRITLCISASSVDKQGFQTIANNVPPYTR